MKSILPFLFVFSTFAHSEDCAQNRVHLAQALASRAARISSEFAVATKKQARVEYDYNNAHEYSFCRALDQHCDELYDRTKENFKKLNALVAEQLGTSVQKYIDDNLKKPDLNGKTFWETCSAADQREFYQLDDENEKMNFYLKHANLTNTAADFFKKDIFSVMEDLHRFFSQNVSGLQTFTSHFKVMGQ